MTPGGIIDEVALLFLDFDAVTHVSEFDFENSNLIGFFGALVEGTGLGGIEGDGQIGIAFGNFFGPGSKCLATGCNGQPGMLGAKKAMEMSVHLILPDGRDHSRATLAGKTGSTGPNSEKSHVPVAPGGMIGWNSEAEADRLRVGKVSLLYLSPFVPLVSLRTIDGVADS